MVMATSCEHGEHGASDCETSFETSFGDSSSSEDECERNAAYN